MFTITVHGTEAAKKALESKMTDILAGVHQANVLTGLDIETDAKMRMTDSGAVDTGRARASIHTETGGNHAAGVRWQKPYYNVKTTYTDNNGTSYDGSLNVEMEAGEAVVGGNVEYLPFIEFGTVHMPSRPFLAPAAKAMQERHLRRLGDVLNK